MKMNYLKLSFTFFILFMLSSACSNSPLVQPAEKSATVTPSLTTTEKIMLPTVTVENTIQVIPTPEVVQVSPTATSSPTPTIVPSPTPLPSPTFAALSSLDESLQTIIFTVSGKQGPEIYRVQVDETGQKAGSVEQIDFLTGPHIRMPDLFPSPDGRHIAVELGGEGGWGGLDILDITNGQLTPLLDNQSLTDQRAHFLDWTPSGENILVMGVGGSDLRDSAWLIDVNTRSYRDLGIKQTAECPEINAATFSPNETTIVYAQRECGQNKTQLWQITLGDSISHLLFESQARIENVWWTHNREHIVFTQWMIKVGSYSWDEFTVGELYMIKADGSQPRLLSSLVMHIDNLPFRPAWSPDGRQIAFVKNNNVESEKQLNELSSNIYIIEASTGKMKQLTYFEETLVTTPIWSPDGSRITFLTRKKETTAQFQAQIITVNDGSLYQFDVNKAITEVTTNITKGDILKLDSKSTIIWLP